MEIDERLLAFRPISVILNFDWEKTTFDERVKMRYDYVQEQKKKNPDYVGWDFLEFFNSLHGPTKTDDVQYMVDFRRIISTTGQFASIWKGELYTSFGTPTKHGYKHIAATINKKAKTILLHRVVASTFIPIPDELKKNRKRLVINHKNDDGCCNWQSNLEWVTQRANHKKAIETGAISLTYFKMTVIYHGPLYGKEYYFLCKADLIKDGFNCPAVYNAAKTKRRYLCGTWEEIGIEEVKDKFIGVPEEDLAIIRDPKYGGYKRPPRLATIVYDGPCKGETFIIYGANQMSASGFGACPTIPPGGSINYKGCLWEQLTLEQARGYHIGLTDAQKKHLFPNGIKP